MKREWTEGELKKRLEEVGVSLTAQRLAIARILFMEADHPTAHEVHQRAVETLSVVSRATVYNTLGTFVEAGLVTEVRSGAEGMVRYDSNTEPHHHLRDRKTGKLIDIPYEAIEIGNLKALKRRFKVDRITVTIDGEPR